MKKSIVVALLCLVAIILTGFSPTFSADEGEQAGRASGGLVNINTATAEELTALDGIGKTYAERIVAFREAHGRFMTIEALKDVKGIGERILEKNRDKITVGPPDSPR